jgi:signal transduction histidine kinase
VDDQVVMMTQEKLTTFGANEGVRVGICLDIREAAGTIFIGGEHALEMFDGRRFVPVIPKDRESFENIWALLGSDRSGLWFDETRGLVHIPIGELGQIRNDPKHKVSYELFDFHDGLPSDLQRSGERPASFESQDGRIWFATQGGMVWIDPNRIVRNSIPPGVTVDSIFTNGKTYHLLSPLTLPARTTSLRIAFTAASMTIPERVRFRYNLEHVDKGWQDSGSRRETTYTNLGPGSYRFRVIACNNDGVWNEAGAVSSFAIAPAFYQTLWFQGLYVLTAVLLLAGAYRLRVRQIARGMDARFNERLAERTRIARELHDTLLQSFQGLMLRLQVVGDLLPAGTAKDQLEQSLQRADRAIAEGRSAVYDLRSSVAMTNDLAQAVRALADELASQDSASFGLVVEGVARDLHAITRDEIYRIAREALRNAFSHACARHIETEITYGDRAFRLRIRDDGQGIPPEILGAGRPGHYGLPGMRERARQIGGKLEIWSGAGTGTEIDLSIAGSIAYRTSAGRSLFRLFQKTGG